MCTKGILLAYDIAENYEYSFNVFRQGNPLVWGWFGWTVLLVCIICIGYWFISCNKQNKKIKHKKEGYINEKESTKTKIGRIDIDQRIIEEYFRAERVRIEKSIELKNQQIMKLKEEQEKKKKLIFDFRSFFWKNKELENDIKKLGEESEELKKELDILEQQRKTKIVELLKKNKELQEMLEDSESKIRKAENEIKKNKEDFLKKILKHKKAGLVLLIILVANRHNMISTAEEVGKTLKDSFERNHTLEDAQINELETEETTGEEAILITEEEEIELREHMDYTFILETKQLNRIMDDDIEDIIFLLNYAEDIEGYNQFIIECKERKIKEKLPEISNSGKTELDVLLNEIAEDLEKPFLNKIEIGKTIQTQKEWENLAPRSSELEKIMGKRIQVLGMEDSISVRRTTYYLLANDYQRLGNECLTQEKDGSQTYYYFGMSIYCCYCALGYEKSGENVCSDKELLNYVKGRYKDIMDNEKKGISKDVVDNAERVYMVLDEYLLTIE